MIKRLLCLLLAAFCAASCLFGCIPGGENHVSGQHSAGAEPSFAESAAAQQTSAPEGKAEGVLKVHFIDVGQGDSAFAELPGGECLLIDCGERDYAGRVISFVDCLGYRKIDYILVTHPHTDHMGGMSLVIESFDVGKIYMPDVVATHSAFSAMLNAVSAKGLKIEIAKDGVCVFAKENLRADLLAPAVIDTDNLNGCSAVLKLQYGGTSFLFAGDAEKAEEAKLVAGYGEALKSDVVKIGHHGSADASSDEFIRAVGAKIGIISCGAGNPYGHPARGVMTSWLAGETEILLRTDLEGTITIVSDGSAVSVAEKTEYDYKWVLNLNGKKIHRPGCEGAANIQDRNRAYSTRTVAELEALGYTPCGICRPEE